MTQTEIKPRIEVINAQIGKLEDMRAEIQKNCQHTQTEVVKYSWRPGCIDDVDMCIDCRAIITFVSLDQVPASETIAAPCGFYIAGMDTSQNCTICGEHISLHK